MSGPALFQETQRLWRNRWAMVGLVGVLAGIASILFTGDSLGDPFAPAGLLGLAIGVGVLGLLGVGALHTEVHPDALHVRFVPLTRQHRFAWSEIVTAEARRYRPILEYGGWGIRWGRNGKAYNVYGNRGVQLVFADGKKLLIGSQRAEALARAIASVRGG